MIEHQETRSHGLGVLTTVHEAIARTRGMTAGLFALLLGAFCALGFAPFHLSPALIIAIVGLVWMLDGARGQRRWGRAMFFRAWAFGFGYFLVGMYWTALPFLVEPEKHAIFLWMPLILLPGGMALIWGAACALAGAFWSASPSRVFIFAIFMQLAPARAQHLEQDRFAGAFLNSLQDTAAQHDHGCQPTHQRRRFHSRYDGFHGRRQRL